MAGWSLVPLCLGYAGQSGLKFPTDPSKFQLEGLNPFIAINHEGNLGEQGALNKGIPEAFETRWCWMP